MEKITELFTKIFEERISNPFTQAFIISWCLWNYKFIVILFSNNTASTTFSLIEKYSFAGLQETILLGFVLPLVSSLFYILIYPYPSKLIFKFYLRKNMELSNLRDVVQNTKQLTLEESQKIRANYARLKSQLIEITNEKDLQIEALVKENDLLKSSPKDINEDKEEFEPNEDIQKQSSLSPNLRDSITVEKKLHKNAMILLSAMDKKSDSQDFVRYEDILSSIEKTEYGLELKPLLAYLRSIDYIKSGNRRGQDGYFITDQGLIDLGKLSFQEK